MLTKHFSIKEFECKCCNKQVMNQDFMITLELLREELEIPMIVTSGYRCERHNKAVGGSSRSQHLIGRAADISTVGMTSDILYTLISSAIDWDFRGIGIGRNFIHIDNRKRGKKLWVY